MAVYGYCRVSTDRQADEGESLDVQRRKLEGYAMQQGWTLDRVFVERGVSGSRPLDERAEGQKLLAAVQPGDVIITSKLDRMFRSVLDALRVLDTLKRSFWSAFTSRMRSLMRSRSASATAERMVNTSFEMPLPVTSPPRSIMCRLISRRFDKLAVAADGPAKGRSAAEVPVSPEQQAAIRHMVEMRRAGLSLRAIADAIKADGFNLSHVGVKKVIEAAEDRQKAA